VGRSGQGGFFAFPEWVAMTLFTTAPRRVAVRHICSTMGYPLDPSHFSNDPCPIKPPVQTAQATPRVLCLTMNRWIWPQNTPPYYLPKLRCSGAVHGDANGGNINGA
jgi:hypothetical protein